MLSNTATPKYYGAFRKDVLDGKIAVNEKIAMEMCRIDALIANPGVYYDDKAIDGYIAYCEGELTLTDGEPLELLPAFKLWAESLLSWFYFEESEIPIKMKDGRIKTVIKQKKKRLVNKQFLIVARGAAKSVYDSTIQGYFLNIDTSTTDQVTLAPTVRQANEVLSPLKTAITRARGPLFKFLTEGSLQNTTGSRAKRQKLASTKNGIENFLNGSILRIIPMTIDSVQGLRSKVNTVDEWLSCDIREDVFGPIEQGASKLDDYVILGSSSEGTVRNGPGDTTKMELMKILKGEFYDPHVSIWWYCLDDIKEVNDPSMWEKANPNIGKTVSYETYMRDVERAEHNPEARNDILAKRFGIPMEGYTYFFTYEETLPSERKNNYWGMPCSMGADLSQGDDFCAFTFIFPLNNGCYGVKTRSYITDVTYNRLPLALKTKYNEFIEEGSLIIMDGAVLDMINVYDDLDKFITTNEYDVRSFGFDPYNAKDFVERWSTENGPFGIEKVIQGARTESVPLGELKKLAGEQMLIFDEKLMSYTMGNCITIQDTNGNRKLLKRRHEQKIDNVAAMMDAWVAYKNNKDSFL